jgi:hypothetical protein
LISPAGGGHVLYLKSDLIQDRWKVDSDNSETRLAHIKQPHLARFPLSGTA